jgi:hypothetical protein
MVSDEKSAPSLSIVVACRDAWPMIRATLDSLFPQALAAGAEIIVPMSRPDVTPPDADRLYPGVKWIQEKAEDSVFQLRALALPYCGAAIIGMTEDHATLDPRWCQAILDAHAQYPEAAAIGGVIENGSTTTLKDWAAFFTSNGRFMRPIRNGVTDDISLQANVSYKRQALPPSFPEFGLIPSIFHRELREGGATLAASDRMVVRHVPELTFGQFTALYFHNARATAASFHVAQPGSRWLLGYAVLLPTMIWRTLSKGFSKRRGRRQLVLGFPFMFWFMCCHAAGELVGHMAGPGDSPQHVK